MFFNLRDGYEIVIYFYLSIYRKQILITKCLQLTTFNAICFYLKNFTKNQNVKNTCVKIAARKIKETFYTYFTSFY